MIGLRFSFAASSEIIGTRASVLSQEEPRQRALRVGVAVTDATTLHRYLLGIRMISRAQLGKPPSAPRLDTLLGQAMQHVNQAEHDRAVSIFEEAAREVEVAFGVKSPYTLKLWNDIAMYMRMQGRLQVAEALLRKVAKASTQHFGREDPDTLGAVNNLAMILYLNKQLEEARRLAQEATTGRTELFGTNHPITLDSAKTTALIAAEQGDFVRAATLQGLVAVGYERLWGEQAPKTRGAKAQFVKYLNGQTNAGDPPNTPRAEPSEKSPVRGD